MHTILVGDVMEQLQTLDDGSVHCCVTSPPYWALRSYLKADDPNKHLEMGSEKTPDEYVAKMVAVFREVRRVLRDDALFWLNIGDKWLPDGNLAGIPWRLALALQADGWWLRSDIIWAKRSPMPESLMGVRWERHRVKVKGGWTKETHPAYTNPDAYDRAHAFGTHGGKVGGPGAVTWRDCPGCDKCKPHGGYVLRRGAWRCTKAHEYIFMLAKSERYYGDGEAVKEDGNHEPHAPGWATSMADRNDRQVENESNTRNWGAAGSRNLRSVWSLKGEPFPEAHFATFPPSLPETCILASTSAKGVCPACGAPWARVLERTPLTRERPHDYVKRTGEDGTGSSCANSVAGVDNRTLDWWPTCECDAGEPIAATVLDPFAGAGTTLLVAERLGRDSIGIELNPEYAAMAERRIRDDAPLLEVTR